MSLHLNQTTSQNPICYAVQFLQLHQGIPEHVVVPLNWVTREDGKGRVSVAYPVEDLKYTTLRVLSFQRASKYWKSYEAIILMQSNNYDRLQQYCDRVNQSSNMNISNKFSGPSERQDPIRNKQKEYGWFNQKETAASNPSPTNIKNNYLPAPNSRTPTPEPKIQTINLNQYYAAASTVLSHNAMFPNHFQAQNLVHAECTISENVKLNPRVISTSPVSNIHLSKLPNESVKSASVMDNSIDNISEFCDSAIGNSLNQSSSNNIFNPVSTTAQNAVSSTKKLFEVVPRNNFPPSHNSLKIKLRRIDHSIKINKNVGNLSTSEIRINSLKDKSLPTTGKLTILQETPHEILNRKRPNEMLPDNAKRPKITPVKDTVNTALLHSNSNNTRKLPNDLKPNSLSLNRDDGSTNSSSLYTNNITLEKRDKSCELVSPNTAIGSKQIKRMVEKNTCCDQKSNTSVVDRKITNLKLFRDLYLQLGATEPTMLKKTNDAVTNLQGYIKSYQNYSKLMNNFMHKFSSEIVHNKENEGIDKVPVSSKEIYKTNSVCTDSNLTRLQEEKNEREHDKDLHKLRETQAKKSHPKETKGLETFKLPDCYDPNDSRWTLKYHFPEPELEELLPYSNIYVNSLELAQCKRQANGHLPSMARQLLKVVFRKEALEVCSFTGGRPNAIFNCATRPGLDQNGREVVLNYINELADCKGWINNDNIIRSLRAYLWECRSRRQRQKPRQKSFYKIRKSSVHIKQKMADIEI